MSAAAARRRQRPRLLGWLLQLLASILQLYKVQQIPLLPQRA
jgi:hypothetical protein